MAVVSPNLFTPAERAFTDMLDKGGILVGDRWFPKESSELERARYLVTYHSRLEKNRRRRERRRALASGPKPRKVCGSVPMDLASQQAHRDPVERRKCLRRATVAPCPTPCSAPPGIAATRAQGKGSVSRRSSSTSSATWTTRS